jgi:hypothetical protein
MEVSPLWDARTCARPIRQIVSIEDDHLVDVIVEDACSQKAGESSSNDDGTHRHKSTSSATNSPISTAPVHRSMPRPPPNTPVLHSFIGG